MVCTTVIVSAIEGGLEPTPPAGATHRFQITIWKAFPWSKSGAEAVSSLASYLAGVSILGYQLDMSALTGWDVLKVEYDNADKIYIWLKNTGGAVV